MQSSGPLLALLVPLAYLAAALVPSALARSVRARWRLGLLGAGAAVVAALASTGWLIVAGPALLNGPALPLGPLGSLALSVRLDALTVVMLLLVTGIALVILSFSRRYLDGERGQVGYVRWFLATLGAASLLVITNNLLLLALAWTASSLALHQLLTFFGERPQAIIAAHKKFLLSRVADLCILAGVLLIGGSLGTMEIDQLLARATALATVPGSLSAGGLLLVGGVLLRSAQLPFHGWLIQVMEAPTPVSALLHAGIVNIGGFVMIRLAGLMLRLDAAQTLLVVAGTLTAIIAALVMTTRVSVKVSLAWSTAAQMGFMLIECGLGAYGLALLHLVAHSLYKANAFLGSGRAVERQVLGGMAPATAAAGLGRWVAAAAVGLLLVGGIGAGLGLEPGNEPSLVAVGFILALALAPLFVRASLSAGWRPMLHASGVGVGLVALYAGWHFLFGALAPTATTASPSDWGRLGLVVAGFALLFVTQALISARPTGRVAQALYPACFAGFYLDEVFTRMTFHLWPPRPLPAVKPLPRNGTARSLERAA
jgi:NAD(P)H-quinone oxidoreductase subunit 5